MSNGVKRKDEKQNRQLRRINAGKPRSRARIKRGRGQGCQKNGAHNRKVETERRELRCRGELMKRKGRCCTEGNNVPENAGSEKRGKSLQSPLCFPGMVCCDPRGQLVLRSGVSSAESSFLTQVGVYCSR